MKLITFTQFYLDPFSALCSYKHLHRSLGLLPSGTDPLRQGKIKQDKASTSRSRLNDDYFTVVSIQPTEARCVVAQG